MNKGLKLITSVGVGAGLMYLFDPDRGNRRRAILRDKTAHALNSAKEAFDKATRDLVNRARGIAAETESLFTSGEVSDDVLVERIRAKLGRVVSHPRAITVTAEQGRVTVSGPVLSHEADSLLDCVQSVPGVKDVENKMELHERADNISALQGGRPRRGERWDVMQTNWSPATRLLAGTIGGAMLGYCMRNRSLLSLTAGTVGTGLLARAITNIEMARLAGLGGRRAIDIHKSINVSAPVEEVFDFWIRQEDFPRLMSNVREVRKTGENRYRWVVAGPAGSSVEWEAEITKLIPNEMIAWKSLPGSSVAQSGIVRFNRVSGDRTNIDIKMTYNPLAGGVGHAVAALFNSDPKREMDEDLMRMKTFIETGQIPRDAAEKSKAAQKKS
jgi:uncharacterized membrane protein